MDSFNNLAPSVPTSRGATAKCEKPSSSSKGRAVKRRNRTAISRAMSKAAGVPSTPQTMRQHAAIPDDIKQHAAIGLTLRDLEDRRWRVSPAVAKEKLLRAGLPYEGRRAGLIYSWASIFRAEGIPEEIAKNTTREDYPDLYGNLLDTSGAAELLGYRDPSSIRKLAGSGNIPETAYIKFGTRGVYRFRRGPLMALRKSVSAGRIV